jgi:hypothetical protein
VTANGLTHGRHHHSRIACRSEDELSDTECRNLVVQHIERRSRFVGFGALFGVRHHTNDAVPDIAHELELAIDRIPTQVSLLECLVLRT